MTLETVGAIVFGWLLGLLAPAISEGIRRRYREKEIRGAVISELREPRHRMAVAAYLFESRFGQFDREFLRWLIQILESYKGPAEMPNLLDIVRKHVEYDDATFAPTVVHMKAQSGSGINVKKYNSNPARSLQRRN